MSIHMENERYIFLWMIPRVVNRSHNHGELWYAFYNDIDNDDHYSNNININNNNNNNILIITSECHLKIWLFHTICVTTCTDHLGGSFRLTAVIIHVTYHTVIDNINTGKSKTNSNSVILHLYKWWSPRFTYWKRLSILCR